jgi:hypothetical protein
MNDILQTPSFDETHPVRVAPAPVAPSKPDRSTYPKGPGYLGDADRQLAVAKALLASSNIRVPLGRDVNGVPIGIPYGSIVKYAEAALAEKGWLTTKMTLLAAQRKETK